MGVQILDETVCISLLTYAFWRNMNPSLLPIHSPAMDFSKAYLVSCLHKATSLDEGKLKPAVLYIKTDFVLHPVRVEGITLIHVFYVNYPLINKFYSSSLSEDRVLCETIVEINNVCSVMLERKTKKNPSFLATLFLYWEFLSYIIKWLIKQSYWSSFFINTSLLYIYIYIYMYVIK